MESKQDPNCQQLVSFLAPRSGQLLRINDPQRSAVVDPSRPRTEGSVSLSYLPVLVPCKFMRRASGETHLLSATTREAEFDFYSAAKYQELSVVCVVMYSCLFSKE